MGSVRSLRTLLRSVLPCMSFNAVPDPYPKAFKVHADADPDPVPDPDPVKEPDPRFW